MTDNTPNHARDLDGPVEGSISTAYLAVLTDYLRPHGVDIASLPGGAALLRQQAEGAIVMPVQDWRELLRRLSQQLGQPDLGLRLGRSARLSHLGLLGYVLQSCGTLGAALERIQRYERLVNDINRLHWSPPEPGPAACVVLRWGMERGRPGALVDECAIATLLQVTRQISGLHDAAVAVDFVNPAPDDLAPYTGFFGITPRFGCDQTRISFPAVLLQLPLQHPDPHLLGLLEKQVDELLHQLPAEADIVQRVRRQLAQRLRGQAVSQADIATDLHVSERTLHRRLQEAGTNFRELRESTRRHLAEEYLRDQRLTLSEVASLLGYSEQSAFTRSFRRWTGQGPKAWRSAH
ncbi:MAG: AraC family transcriptional regulator [Perlucidibaca sp.]